MGQTSRRTATSDPSAQIFRYSDSDLDYEAIIVIDSLKAGKSSGGIRISEAIDEDEIRAMAHSMTLKYLFLSRQMGGAKCGIRIPKECSADHKKKILTSFGAQASPILQTRQYIPYMDMRCSKDDIHTILKAANAPLYKISDSSYFTALSVVASIQAASTYQGRTLQHRSCIIEGFGNVGSHIASLLERSGIRLVGISTAQGAIYHHEGLSISDLLEKRKQVGDRVVNEYPEYWIEPKEMLLEKPGDILIPCARYHALHQDNMESIHTTIIAPGANNPYDAGVEPYLFDQKVLCLPDFITNIGGILGTSLYDNGISMAHIQGFFDQDFSSLISLLIKKSTQLQKTPGDIALLLFGSEQGSENSKGSRSPFSMLSPVLSHLPTSLHRPVHLHLEKRRIQKQIKTLKAL